MHGHDANLVAGLRLQIPLQIRIAPGKPGQKPLKRWRIGAVMVQGQGQEFFQRVFNLRPQSRDQGLTPGKGLTVRRHFSRAGAGGNQGALKQFIGGQPVGGIQ